MMRLNNTEYLTKTEFANAIGISNTTLWRWVQVGKLKPQFKTPSGKEYYTREQVDAYWRGEYSD